MAFQFGSGSSAAGGFSFGAKPSASAGSSFTLGGLPVSTGTGGFSFGLNATVTTAQAPGPFSITPASNTFQAANPSTAGFSFGSTAAPAGFSFGSSGLSKTGSTATSAPLFSFGSSAPSALAPAAGLSVSDSKPQSASLFSFGTNAAPATSGLSSGGSLTIQPSSGFSLGSTGIGSQQGLAFAMPSAAVVPQVSSAVSSTAPTVFAPTATSLSAPSFSLGGSTISAKPGFSFVSGQAASAPGAAIATSATSSTSLMAPVSAPFKLSGASLASAPAVSSESAVVASMSIPASSVLASVTSSVSVTAPSAKPMSYKELEDVVGRWLQDLTEQENAFLRQASQVNIWDRQLMENGEQITELHYEVARVKAEQQRLDRELDFILSQQQELEELLVPIETQLKLQETLQYSQHADIEREKTYKLAESIDCQLKHMMQDLKEIIDYINSSNLQQAKTGDEPMVQIAKILNAHMDSLQWIDQNANLLQKRVDDVSRLMETRRREHDRTFNLNGYE